MWLAAVGVAPLAACAGDANKGDVGDTARTNDTGQGDSATGSDSGRDTAPDDTSSSDTAAPDWATGGTAGMTEKAAYPDPFVDPVGVCALVATTTAGPCTTATDRVREDISEGWRGLPVRLLLRFVDADCVPATGVTVRVWHTNVEGSYSGQTPNNAMCLQTEDYAASDFFRGVQVTDARGVAAFDTCFPGAYPGRAVHVHFQVVREGRSSHVSQLFVPDALTREVFASHPDYAPFGQPDTSLAADGISRAISADALALLTLDVARMADGALLASQTLLVRGS